MRTHTYTKRPVEGRLEKLAAWLGIELGNIQRAIPVFSRQIVYDSAAPTTGTWLDGDIVLNEAPAAGGFIGWVCTTAGTPGTWKEWGEIEP